MSRTIDHLKDEADRAERLARTGMDPLTVERLRAFAAECRSRIATERRDAPAAGLPGRDLDHHADPLTHKREILHKELR